jgi:hypothetical protein
MAAKSFGVMVRPIEDMDLINSMLSSPEKKQVTLNNKNMIDNRSSFLANAQDPTQLATPVKKSSFVENSDNPLEDLVRDIGSA